MTAPRTICVVTGSRADYSHLQGLMKAIQDDDRLTLQVAVTGAHLAAEFGETIQSIEADGFQITKTIEIEISDDSIVGITKATGQATCRFGKVFSELNPDIVVLLGDRYEIFSAAQAALIANIPIAHIHGGESTLGAIDDSIRHAITKMSYLHFTAAPVYRNRVIQMGESKDRVFCFGAPGLDRLHYETLLSRHQLEEEINILFAKMNFLVTYHPVTAEREDAQRAVESLLSALDSFSEANVFFTFPGADAGHLAIRRMLEFYVSKEKNRRFLFSTLGARFYLSLLGCVDVVIGNSSSGIIEAPSLKKASVDIGNRQEGRLRAASVLHCEANREEIVSSIKKATSADFQKQLSAVKNPYDGGGYASEKIKEVLKTYPFSAKGLKKEFVEIDSADFN